MGRTLPTTVSDKHRVVELYLHAARVLEHELNRRLSEDAGVSYAQYQILAVLAQREQCRMRMGDLAIAVGLSKSCLSHAIRRMQAREWVQREAGDCGDARTIDAVLTDRGLSALVVAEPVYTECVGELAVDRLSPDRMHELHEASRTLLPQAVSEPAATTLRAVS